MIQGGVLCQYCQGNMVKSYTFINIQLENKLTHKYRPLWHTSFILITLQHSLIICYCWLVFGLSMYSTLCNVKGKDMLFYVLGIFFKSVIMCHSSFYWTYRSKPNLFWQTTAVRHLQKRTCPTRDHQFVVVKAMCSAKQIIMAREWDGLLRWAT